MNQEADILVTENTYLEGYILVRRVSVVSSQSLADADGLPIDKYLFFRDSDSIARYRQKEAQSRLKTRCVCILACHRFLRPARFRAVSIGANAILEYRNTVCLLFEAYLISKSH
jgi:hypothetical protein